MKEITRELLHKSIRDKPVEVQDKFLEVANSNIRKGSTTSQAISLANKAVEDFEDALEDNRKLLEEKQVLLNKAKIAEAIKLNPPMFTHQLPAKPLEEVDPEDIKSIYFDKEARLVIEFADGYKILSKNSIPPSYIEQHVAVNVNPVFDYIRFNIDFLDNSILPHEEGLLFYDKKSHALSYYNDESDVVVNIGQETLLRVYNNTASTLLNGKVVYISGAFSGWPTAALASCTSKTQAYAVLGLATADIEPSTYGYVCITGKVNDINTSSFSAGDTLYLDAISGNVTKIPPLQPNYVVSVGEVLTSSSTQGSILVRIDRRDWFPSLQLLSPAASITLPTVPTVFKPSNIIYNDGFLYDDTTGEITFLESSNYTFTVQFNAYPSASNKNIYFYADEFDGTNWVIGRYTARQIRLVNQVEDQVQVTAARYFKVGNKLRFNIWGDATVHLNSTDLPGTTPGTVTLPAFRLNIA